jgi:hypothetical protein
MVSFDVISEQTQKPHDPAAVGVGYFIPVAVAKAATFLIGIYYEIA